MTVTRRSVLIAGTATPVVLAGTSEVQAAPARRAAVGERRSVPLRDGWRFALVNPSGLTDPTGAYARAAEPGYDDSDWRHIIGDWSIEQTVPGD
jgi:beta-galactosidase